MTLKEIAAKAGVSISTVSRIIHSPDNSFARKEVRDRIWAIVRETGYIPNTTAQSLQARKNASRQIKPDTGNLTCILGGVQNETEDEFWNQLTRAIEYQAMHRQYPIRNIQTINKQNILQEQVEMDIDGAIVLGKFSTADWRFLQSNYKNLLYVGSEKIQIACDQIICDAYETASIAMEYLLACGHQQIAYIGPMQTDQRYKAYKDALDDYHIEFESAQNILARDKAILLLEKIINTSPTAIFCATDSIAIVVLKLLQKLKIKVPDQISLISIDDIEHARYTSPMLTTMSIPIIEIGSIAVQTIVNRIEKQHQIPLTIFLPSKLAIRDSVRNLNLGAYI